MEKETQYSIVAPTDCPQDICKDRKKLFNWLDNNSFNIDANDVKSHVGNLPIYVQFYFRTTYTNKILVSNTKVKNPFLFGESLAFTDDKDTLLYHHIMMNGANVMNRCFSNSNMNMEFIKETSILPYGAYVDRALQCYSLVIGIVVSDKALEMLNNHADGLKILDGREFMDINVCRDTCYAVAQSNGSDKEFMDFISNIFIEVKKEES